MTFEFDSDNTRYTMAESGLIESFAWQLILSHPEDLQLPLSQNAIEFWAARGDFFRDLAPKP